MKIVQCNMFIWIASFGFLFKFFFRGDYANDACWREDNRVVDTATRYEQVVVLAGKHPVSRQWKGYWQRRKEAA